MGWLYTDGSTKKSLVEEIIRDNKFSVIAHSLIGKNLWLVNKDTFGTYIVLYILDKDSRGWGYKDISEDMGPFCYNCPLKFLALAPVANARWRAAVLKFHTNKKQRSSLVLNRPYKLTGNWKIAGKEIDTVSLISRRPLFGSVSHTNGMLPIQGKLPRSILKSIVIPESVS